MTVSSFFGRGVELQRLQSLLSRVESSEQGQLVSSLVGGDRREGRDSLRSSCAEALHMEPVSGLEPLTYRLQGVTLICVVLTCENAGNSRANAVKATA